MEYDVRVRVQGAPGETGQVSPLIVDTEGHLAVERGRCALSYYQYEGEEALPVKTSIRLERSTTIRPWSLTGNAPAFIRC